MLSLRASFSASLLVGNPGTASTLRPSRIATRVNMADSFLWVAVGTPTRLHFHLRMLCHADLNSAPPAGFPQMALHRRWGEGPDGLSECLRFRRWGGWRKADQEKASRLDPALRPCDCRRGRRSRDCSREATIRCNATGSQHSFPSWRKPALSPPGRPRCLQSGQPPCNLTRPGLDSEVAQSRRRSWASSRGPVDCRLSCASFNFFARNGTS